MEEEEKKEQKEEDVVTRRNLVRVIVQDQQVRKWVARMRVIQPWSLASSTNATAERGRRRENCVTRHHNNKCYRGKKKRKKKRENRLYLVFASRSPSIARATRTVRSPFAISLFVNFHLSISRRICDFSWIPPPLPRYPRDRREPSATTYVSSGAIHGDVIRRAASPTDRSAGRASGALSVLRNVLR